MMPRPRHAGTGAFHHPVPSVSSVDSRASGATTTRFTRSAPAILPSLYLDGATVTSSTQFRAMSIYAGTNTLYVGSQDGTATLFPVLTIRFFSAGIYIHDHVQHTNEWVQDENGPRWIRRIAALEPSSTWPQPAGAPSSPPPETKTMCDCCAAARTIRELEKLMADDKAKTPPTNDDVDHYFPALINATGGQRLIMPS